VGIAIGIFALVAGSVLFWVRRIWARERAAPSAPLPLSEEEILGPGRSDPDALELAPRRDLSEEEWLRLLDESVRLQVGLPLKEREEPTPTVPPAVSAPPVRKPVAPPSPSNAPPTEDQGDLTLRMLPGRLEAVTGYPGHEIRFVALPGVTRFTLGRMGGPRYRHIQVPEPTVSRMHAFMEFRDGGWSIGNLSETNGVVVDGQVLSSVEETVGLHEGSRIEMGEVIFIFRER